MQDMTIVVAGGREISLLNPQLDELTLDELAASLAGICRFNGATPEHYSVAQHSVLVATLLLKELGPRHAAAGLLHDASEAFLGDMVWPLKKIPEVGGPYLALENAAMEAVARRWGVEFSGEVAEAVHIADACLLLAETRDFFNDPAWARERIHGEGISPWPVHRIVPETREVAALRFVRLAHTLGLR